MTPKIPRIVTGTLSIADTKRKNSYNLHFDDLPIEFICNPRKWKEKRGFDSKKIENTTI